MPVKEVLVKDGVIVGEGFCQSRESCGWYLLQSGLVALKPVQKRERESLWFLGGRRRRRVLGVRLLGATSTFVLPKKPLIYMLYRNSPIIYWEEHCAKNLYL